MTHDELLDKIEDIEYWQEQYAGKTFMKAIRAVVELHKPYQGYVYEEKVCQVCRSKQWAVVYPCQTIQVIEKELA